MIKGTATATVTSWALDSFLMFEQADDLTWPIDAFACGDEEYVWDGDRGVEHNDGLPW